MVKPMEEITCPNGKKSCSTALERKVRPQKEQSLNCPRCNSTNTKFCYYNNYSLTQPRYFCKTCRRYWTEGGSLRSIPVGGGSRKNKRSSSSFSTSNPKFPNHLQVQDLNLGFPLNNNHGHNTQHEFRTLSEFIQLPTIETPTKTQIPNSSTSANLSALELLNGLTSFTPMQIPIPTLVPGSDPNVVYTSGLNFSLDSLTNHIHGYPSLQGGVQQEEANNNGRLLFPFQDLKSVPSNTTATATTLTTSTTTNTTGYWTGLLGSTAGASW